MKTFNFILTDAQRELIAHALADYAANVLERESDAEALMNAFDAATPDDTAAEFVNDFRDVNLRIAP